MKTITAAINHSIGQNGSIPKEIVFLPEGDHEISATVDGSARTIKVRVPSDRGQAITAKLQAALAKRNAESVRPHMGFDHRPGAASALPKSFRWAPGIGVVLEVDWTASGQAAIEGRDFSYFSPTFLLGDDGIPDGLPDKGEVGSLVNSPAFRSLHRIAASDAGVDSDRFYRDLATDAGFGEVATEDEAKAFLAEYGADGQKTSAQRAEERARHLVASGSADSMKQGWIQAAQADNDLYVAAAQGTASLPGLSGITDADSAFEKRARALVTAGDAEDIDSAFAIVAASDPAAYSEYLKSLA